MPNLARPLGHSARFTDPTFSTTPATVAPWWRYTQFTLPPATPAFFKWEMLDQTNLAPAIKNDQQWPVFITEIRWMIINDLSNPNIVNTTFFGAKLHSDLQGDITGKHIPIGTYMTDDRAFVTNQGNHHNVIKLPVRYQQSHKGTFMIKLQPTTADAATRQLDICLRGFDAVNRTPIVISKRHTTGAINQETTVAFDDDRDGPVRDMLIEDIAFGGVTMYYNAGAGVTDPFSYLNVRLEPNAGPRWTATPWTPLVMLAEHVPADSIVNDGYKFAIHQPMTPYPLNAGHALRVNMMAYATYPSATIIRLIARGVQGVQDVVSEVR